MNPQPFLRSAIALLGLSLASCSIDGGTKLAKALEPGIRYEVRPALAKADNFATKKVTAYFFMLDAPPPVSPLNPFLAATSALRLSGVRTTAYCHAEDDHRAYGRLAAVGTPLRFGSVCSAAADWSRYPVGTIFRIKSQPGVVYEVDDYGSALVGSGTIDLYRPTIGSMNDWGVRAVDIEIVKWGSFHDSLRLMRDRVHHPHVRRMFLDIQKRLNQAADNRPIPTTPATAMAAPPSAA